MRVLVLGGTGMLGHQLVRAFSSETETWVTTRAQCDILESFGVPPKRQLYGVRLEDGDLGATLSQVLDESNPNVVVNAIGALKPLRGTLDHLDAVTLNAALPWTLARLCDARGSRAVTISTDCVFSGSRGGYSEVDIPDARDIYGLSKYLGELLSPHLTIRTSIIGRELSGNRGLVEWFLGQQGRVNGYRNAKFSGLPTVVLARLIRDLILNETERLEGLFHVAAEPIDKYSLLGLLQGGFGTDIEIVPDESVVIDRSLDGTLFAERTRFASPAWTELVEMMVSDALDLDYDQIRQKR